MNKEGYGYKVKKTYIDGTWTSSEQRTKLFKTYNEASKEAYEISTRKMLEVEIIRVEIEVFYIKEDK